jgi:hypothetical protein
MSTGNTNHFTPKTTTSKTDKDGLTVTNITALYCLLTGKVIELESVEATSSQPAS